MAKSLGRVAQVASLGLIKGKDLFPDAPTAQVADKQYFDVSKEAGAARDLSKPLLQSSQANQQAVAPGQQQALAQMALAATGQGPSLAEAQLRSAQDRGFSQQLAAAQAQRAASPALAQRQLLLNMGNANRDLAQQSAIARLQERDAFLQQANVANQNLRTDVAGDYQYATAPKQALQNWEMARVGGINNQANQNFARDQALAGAVLSGAGSALGGAMSKMGGGAAAVKPGLTDATGGMPGRMFAKDGGLAMNEKCYAPGGPVSGPGTPTSDSIPAQLSDGEFVVKASVVAKPGMLEMLQKINAGKMPAPKAAKEAGHYGKVLHSRKGKK